MYIPPSHVNLSSEFVDLIPPDSKEGGSVIGSMGRNINILQKYFDQICYHVDTKKKLTYKLPIKDPNGNVENAKLYLKHLQNKFQKFKGSFFSYYSVIVSQIVTFMMQCQESNLPAKCHIKSLKRYVQKEYTKNKTQIKLRSKIAKIEDYIKQNETIYPEYDFQLLQIQLAKSIHFIDQKTLYSPESEVDVLINQYIYPRIEDIDEILHDILKSQKPKLLNFTKLEIFIKEVINELQPKNEEEYYIIRNSLLRICFSQLHIISPNLLFDLDPISFSNSCNTVIKSTPKDLCLNERLFSIEMLDKTIIELTETNSHLKEATENLKLLNFYVNPPDILNCVFSSLKCCEMFVHDNTYDEKKKKSKVQSEMSFDDFFPLFLAIFAVNPPPNSLRIGWFFTAMYGIDMAIPFSFAKLILTSAINTLKDFSLERFRMVSSDSF